MTISDSSGSSAFWKNFAGPNLGYVIELYESFLQDASSVSDDMRQLFTKYGPPMFPTEERSLGTEASASTAGNIEELLPVISAAHRLTRNIREYGHLTAKLNPIEDETRPVPLLELHAYGVNEGDLARIPIHWIWPNAPVGLRTALDAVKHLLRAYTGTIAFEFVQVHNQDERNWLTHMVESGQLSESASAEDRRVTLERLIEVEEFERFLHRTFVGQKRFSIEGVDMLVPMLDELVRLSVGSGVSSVMMGMAHRGRLNVLAHVLRKPYSAIFSEFHSAPNKELVPSEGSMGINYGWTGDVKYHLGANRTVTGGETRQARIRLANNPSHLEFVNPVVEGYARAAQDDRSRRGAPVHHPESSLAVLVHGDAAFPGEGVVPETLNLSQLNGYTTGGTIHVIANNQLGFTAEAHEGRSTRYASDLAKGFEIPVVHVNADDPEACLMAIRFAHAYRERFHKDFLIDLIGYRKWGHNEADDPTTTQPQMYTKINAHPSARTLYARRLESEGVIRSDEVDALERKVQEKLREAYSMVASGNKDKHPPELDPNDHPVPTTGVALSRLQALNDALLDFPEGFHVNPKLQRILERRRGGLEGEGTVDWGHAEALAFATLLEDGVPIRITGQDSERGTFGHRHMVLHDIQNGTRFCVMHGLETAKASFAIHNSPLSETAVIGFEYGYNVESPETLVLWEGQFGDFANVGQVLIDQFIASGRAKWAQPSGLVMLLPHGYEGQGPEHSSGRLERFLQLSAENNWRVVNLTSAAQYFHVLRFQAATLQENPRPLIVMTPKSLLRNPRAASRPEQFTNDGQFQQVLDEPLTANNRSQVERLIMCSGKVAIDVANTLDSAKNQQDRLAVVRVEQLYPFPEGKLKEVLARYPKLKEVVWLQEEPKNMGAWTFMEPRIRSLLDHEVDLKYIGRPSRSSPAEGIAEAHEAIQKKLIEDATQMEAQGILMR